MKNKAYISVLVFSLSLLLLEGYLRGYWGFCDTVLIQEDPQIEYIAKPSQDRYRFRRHIYYNKFSQRSQEPSEDQSTVLGFGDSVLNGGVMTDQDSLATTLLSSSLSSIKPVQVLNISAGSWGPDNCAAYLKKYGDFGAKAAFLVCSSHDAHDNITHEAIVDKNPSFPSEQYPSAIIELLDRYAIPKLKAFFHIGVSNKEELGIRKNGSVFNPGFKELYQFSVDRHIPFFIYLHPDIHEVEKGRYNQEGLEIIDFCRKNQVPLILGMEYMDKSFYRDGIHINEKGQHILHDVLNHFIISKYKYAL